MTELIKNLSVIIITKNCEGTIAACLRSVAECCDEIIVLDSGSTDNTVAHCRQFTDKVFVTDWPGFGVQKQRALDLATREWVLSIDADEVMTRGCQQAIRQAVKQSEYNGYRIKRLMVFLNKTLRYGGCSDQPLRLFKKEKARFTNKIVHESVICQGKVGVIDQPLLHYSYSDLSHWIGKMNLYTDLSLKQESHKKGSLSKAIASFVFTFFKKYIIKKGFLDGRMGFILAMNSAVSSYYKYLKLALQPKENK